MTELRNLRGRINELETDLRDRDEEVKLLKEQQLKHSINGTQEDSDAIRVSSEDSRLKSVDNDLHKKTFPSIGAMDVHAL